MVSDFTDSVNSENVFRIFRIFRIPEMFSDSENNFFQVSVLRWILCEKVPITFLFKRSKNNTFLKWMNFCKIAIILYHFFNNLHNKRKNFHYPNRFIKLNAANFFKFFWTKVMPYVILTRLISSFFLNGKDSLNHSCQDLTGIL